MKPLRIYIASHFFNRGGMLETEELAQTIERALGDKVSLYVPHRNDSINDKKGNDAQIDNVAIYMADMNELHKADILIANLDGVEIDAGVSGEVMATAMFNEVAVAKGEPSKVIIGYTTDMRRNVIEPTLLKSIQQSDIAKATEMVEQHKGNFLYRNLMILGAIETYGEVVTGYANNTDYMFEIVNIIKRSLS